MKNFTIEPIIDAYLISGPVRKDGGHSKTARPTLVEAKNLIFSLVGANAKAEEPKKGSKPKEPKDGWKPNLNFKTEDLKNGHVLYQPSGDSRIEEKVYFATAQKLAEAIDALIDENINPDPQS